MPHRDDEHDDFDDDYRGGVEPHRGAIILVLGILSIVVCGVTGIFAWVMGKRDLDLISRGLMDRDGEGLTKAGYILGIIGTILFIIQLLVVVAYIALIGLMVARK
ncbi:MAG TPA: DUF4190 domain-containing protein [Gemmataceae bacterium]|nr:DUF4190 domain-containing protein [Gemmataceae bacterium]